MALQVQTNSLTNNIKTFLLVDDQIRLLHEQLKELKRQKNDAQDNIMAAMIEKKWQNLTIDVGKHEMSMVEKKHYSTMSFSYLEKSLTELIPDKSQVAYVIKYLKDNREVKTNHEIVMSQKT